MDVKRRGRAALGRRQTPRRRRRGSRGNAPAAPARLRRRCVRGRWVFKRWEESREAQGAVIGKPSGLRPSGRPMTAPCAPGPPGVSRASSPLPRWRAAPSRICCFAAAGCSSTSGVQGRRRYGDTRPDRRCLGCCLGLCPGLALGCSFTDRRHQLCPVLAKGPRRRRAVGVVSESSLDPAPVSRPAEGRREPFCDTVLTTADGFDQLTGGLPSGGCPPCGMTDASWSKNDQEARTIRTRCSRVCNPPGLADAGAPLQNQAVQSRQIRRRRVGCPRRLRCDKPFLGPPSAAAGHS